MKLTQVNKKSVASGGVVSRKSAKPSSLPFQSVIYADSQYAIFGDMKAYQRAPGARDGLDIDHLKVALKVRDRIRFLRTKKIVHSKTLPSH